MKPTPGPWETDDDSQRIDGIGTVHMFRVVAPDGAVVAEFSNAGCNEITYDDDGEGCGRHYDFQAMANANLIAAAPDLYAVLNSIFDASVPFNLDDARTAAKAALAKARGEVSR